MVRVKVVESCNGYYWWYGIFESKKQLMRNTAANHGSSSWRRKDSAIRNAKAMAEKIGIKYDPEIVKQHGC